MGRSPEEVLSMAETADIPGGDPWGAGAFEESLRRGVE